MPAAREKESVADLVSPEALEKLATPANRRLGREIAAGGGVEFVEHGPLRVKAKVTGGQRRTVELEARPDGLSFRCSCTTKPDLFCKHCAAAAIAIRDMAPRRRR
jgi:uncharacterized Zn finger protein